jgi:tripartite-type tricarboxylate transporter receptor subunit TctC
MSTKKMMLAVVGALTVLQTFGLGTVWAAYPDKPIRIILPYPPGGSSDTPTRILANRLAALSGQAFVVENRGGAGGALGASEVARATPDGYTVLVSSTALPIASALKKKPPFDAVKDFRHVATFALVPIVLVANPKSAPAGFESFVAASRSAPGKFTYASAGSGSPGHLGSEMLKQALDVDWLHVPYKGTGPALVDLIGGRVDVAVVGQSSVQGHIKAGAVKPLAALSKTRSPQYPLVPAASETAPGFEFEMWFGFAMPAETPPEIVVRFGRLVEQAMKEPELQAQLAESGVKPTYADAAETATRVRRETTDFSRLGARSGISLD